MLFYFMLNFIAFNLFNWTFKEYSPTAATVRDKVAQKKNMSTTTSVGKLKLILVHCGFSECHVLADTLKQPKMLVKNKTLLTF